MSDYTVTPQGVIYAGVPATFFVAPIGIPVATYEVSAADERNVLQVMYLGTDGHPQLATYTFAEGSHTVTFTNLGGKVDPAPLVITAIPLPTVTNPLGRVIPNPLEDPSNPFIELLIGVASNRDIFLLDEQDQPEDLSSVTAATLTIKKQSTDVVPVLQKSMTAGTLTLDVTNSKFSASFSQSDSALFTVGTFYGDISAQIGGIWYNTGIFEVRASNPITVPA